MDISDTIPEPYSEEAHAEESDSKEVHAEAALTDAESTFLQTSFPFQPRYLVTQVGAQRLAFPPEWIAEVMLVDRSQILHLPFYNSALLGVVHHQGRIVPLLTIQNGEQQYTTQLRRMKETITAVRLSNFSGSLAGIGLIVDQVIGSQQIVEPAEISTEALAEASTQVSTDLEPPIKVFQLEDIPQSVWQPQRWHSTIT